MEADKFRWIKTIHVAKKELGLSDEMYRAVMDGAAGISSSKELQNVEQYKSVLAAFKMLGFAVKPKLETKNDIRATGRITYRQEYYIKGLWSLASKAKDEKSLRGMIKRIGGVDDVSFLPRKNASAVILALRDICWKAGYNPDKKGVAFFS